MSQTDRNGASTTPPTPPPQLQEVLDDALAAQAAAEAAAAAAATTPVAAPTHAAASKTPPVDADEVPLIDSAASFGLKRLTWANLKSALSSLFQNQTATAFTTGGTSTAYTLTPVPAIAALADKQKWNVEFNATAGTTPTLAVSGLTAKSIKKYNSSGALVAVGATDIIASMISDVEYSASDDCYILLNPLPQQPVAVVPVRQTVLAAPVDTSGLPSFLPSTSASLVLATQNVTSTAPLVITASNGSNDAGDVNRVGQVTGNTLSWTVGASATSYLPVTVNADGTLTAVTPVTLAPIYQWGGTPSVTNNQYTYNIQEGKMYKGNGTTAPQVNDVIIGEAVSGATTITSTVAYAVRGRYKSAFIATLPNSATVTTQNSNLGVEPEFAQITIKCTTTDGGFAVGDTLRWSTGGGYNGVYVSPGIGANANKVWLSTGGASAFSCVPKGGGASASLTAASWSYRLEADRGW